MKKLDVEALESTATVFSPHPDDETLSCGGTIIKKKKAGAEVKIIFMTDGRKEHPHLISENKLKCLRISEALAASRMLGLEENDVLFLGYGGELSKNLDSAIHKVAEILQLQQPDQIFIPYKGEPHPDHSATNRIVMSALQTYEKKATIYEYPIWLWNELPWVFMPLRRGRSHYPSRNKMGLLKHSFISTYSLLRDFRCSVYIGDVLQLKRAALDQYRSQMTRLIPDARWSTLGDESDGKFLKCFFQDHEFFYQHVLSERRI